MCPKLIIMEMQVIAVSPIAAKVIRMVENAIAKSPTGVSFFSVRNYTNDNGEKSHYSINLGASYGKAKEKDIKFLYDLDVTQHSWKSDMKTVMEAKSELIKSFENPDQNRSNGQKEAYHSIIGSALKVHKATGDLYIYGYLKRKRVLVKGEYKGVNSSAKTLAKNEVRKLLRTDKFRMFKVHVENELKANGRTLAIDFEPYAMPTGLVVAI